MIILLDVTVFLLWKIDLKKGGKIEDYFFTHDDRLVPRDANEIHVGISTKIVCEQLRLEKARVQDVGRPISNTYSQMIPITTNKCVASHHTLHSTQKRRFQI